MVLLFAHVKKSKQKFVVTSALPQAGSLRISVRSLERITRLFHKKLQINLTFCTKSLCIPNFCSKFAAELGNFPIVF